VIEFLLTDTNERTYALQRIELVDKLADMADAQRTRGKRQVQLWGWNIDRILAEKQIAVSDVLERAKMTAQQLSDVKTQPNPKLLTLRKLADAMLVPLSELFRDPAEGAAHHLRHAESPPTPSSAVLQDAIRQSLWRVITDISFDLGRRVDRAREKANARGQAPTLGTPRPRGGTGH
jgi:hypothetical protein